MKFINIQGTSQENIAKEVEDVAKRRGLELSFQVLLHFNLNYIFDRQF
jgi:phytanoyl-CoA hydroxylase